MSLALTAAKLKAGESGTIDSIEENDLGCRLLTIGLRPGSRLKLVRSAPFGKGWLVKIDRRSLALRPQELACIRLK